MVAPFVLDGAMNATMFLAYSTGQKNDFRDAEAIAETMQRLTMKFVATKTAEQLDLLALHRVRAHRLWTFQRTHIGACCARN